MGAEFKAGDRVTVTLEGTVTEFDEDGGKVELRVLNKYGLDSYVFADTATVKKPLVEVFKPGDVVRHKAHGDIRVLSHEGYINLSLGGDYYRFGHGGTAYPNLEAFTSDKFERVEL